MQISNKNILLNEKVGDGNYNIDIRCPILCYAQNNSQSYSDSRRMKNKITELLIYY